MWLWRKLASAKWEDAWEERLAHLPPERLVMIRPAASKMLRLEAYLDEKKEASQLLKMFGGTISQIKRSIQPVEAPQRTLRFGKTLTLVSDPQLLGTHISTHTLVIPAAMAFGTGEHATTAMCLRMLLRLAPKTGDWSMADLGCGTGVFALAARKLGASNVLGIDYDPHAIRTAKQNSKMNRIGGIDWEIADVLTRKFGRQKFDLIAANLFSELLVKSAPKLVKLLKPGGKLICSGLLTHQESDVVSALGQTGFELEEKKRKGKWIALVWRFMP